MLEESLSEGATASSSLGLSPRKSNQIYLIDDDTALRGALHILLSDAGFVSWPFSSASDFLRDLPELEPAPILLDICMPDIDGLALMTILAHRGILWPIIVMTAHGNVTVAVEAMKLGACEFLEKPFEFEVLETSLNLAISGM